MRTRLLRIYAPLLPALLQAACLAPEPAPPVHWYRPLPGPPPQEAPSPRGGLRPVVVQAARHLGAPLVWREEGSPDVGFHPGDRWTEDPDERVQAAVERELFESGAFRRSRGRAPSLEIRLDAFEEVRSPAGSRARVEGVVRLLDSQGAALLEERIREEEPLGAPGPAGLARALGPALSRFALRVREAVEAAWPKVPGS